MTGESNLTFAVLKCLNEALDSFLRVASSNVGLLALRCKFGYTINLCRLAFRPETLRRYAHRSFALSTPGNREQGYGTIREIFQGRPWLPAHGK